MKNTDLISRLGLGAHTDRRAGCLARFTITLLSGNAVDASLLMCKCSYRSRLNRDMLRHILCKSVK